MEVSRQSMAEQFRLLKNHELRQLANSAEMTELAREVAAGELEARGIAFHRQRPPAASEPGREESRDADDDAERGGGDDVDLVQVARYLDPMEAEILRSRLEAEGIFVVLTDHNMGGVNPFFAVVGGARVLVPEPQLDAAREVVKAVARGDYKLDDQSDTGNPA
jgi:hypothetical protein